MENFLIKWNLRSTAENVRLNTIPANYPTSNLMTLVIDINIKIN